MLYIQNWDLWSVFNEHQNFEFLLKKLENYASYKNPMNQDILFPHFTSLFQIWKL